MINREKILPGERIGGIWVVKTNDVRAYLKKKGDKSA